MSINIFINLKNINIHVRSVILYYKFILTIFNYINFFYQIIVIIL